MDLMDKIDATRFLGREFLVWLWFESERKECLLDLPGGETCELWLEEQLTLTSGEDKSESKLKASTPSATPEAKEALRQGKLPTKAKLRIERGIQSWGFLFNAENLSVSSVQVPGLIKEDTDEKFYERMQLIEELEAMLMSLYEGFLVVRTSEDWGSDILPALREWVLEGQGQSSAGTLAAPPRPKTKASTPMADALPTTESLPSAESLPTTESLPSTEAPPIQAPMPIEA